MQKRAESFSFEIAQTLHGYSEGHSLLASSTVLDAADRRKIMIMSDLAGPSFAPGFEPYIQSYTLPNSKAYVLAKTWAATEMPRPGCVWTHSLIIPRSSISHIADLGLVAKLFRRPSLNEGFKSFEKAVQILQVIPEPTFSSLNVRFFEKYFDPSATQIVLLADKSEPFESSVLACWRLVWGDLKASVEFSTGLLSPRQLELGSFLVAIAPRGSRRQLERSAGITFLDVEDLDSRFTNQQERSRTIGLSDLTAFSKFIDDFGDDLSPERTIEPAVLALATELSAKVENFGTFFRKLAAVTNQSPENKLISQILRRDTTQFPGLNAVPEASVLFFALTELSDEHRQKFAGELSERLKTLVVRSPEDARHLLVELSQSIKDDICYFASVELYLGLLRQGCSDHLPVHGRVVVEAFARREGLWESPTALRELCTHPESLEGAIEVSKLSSSERVASAALALREIGRDGIGLVLKLIAALPFAEFIVFVQGFPATFDFQDEALRRVLHERRSEFAAWIIDTDRIAPDLLREFIFGADLRNEIDAQVILSQVEKTMSETHSFASLPQEALVYALARSFRMRFSARELFLESLYGPVYQIAKAGKLSRQSLDFIAASTVAPYFWSGWDQCARLRITLLEMLKDDQITAESFVRASGGVMILSELVREAKNFFFTDRHAIKQALKRLLNSPSPVASEVLELVEGFVEEDFGW